jgi:peptide deformylase
MESTLATIEGLGLAAPQVGISLRVCIAQINEKIIPMINPEITWKSEEKDIMEEGCLSLPKINIHVPRSIRIIVRYQNTKGGQEEREIEHLNARIVQHEIDHLNGILIVDYV